VTVHSDVTFCTSPPYPLRRTSPSSGMCILGSPLHGTDAIAWTLTFWAFRYNTGAFGSRYGCETVTP